MTTKHPWTAIAMTGILMVTAQLARAAAINVADHGIVPGRDVTYELNKLIQSVQATADVTLTFPKGRYEFYPESALEAHRAVSNHDNSLKRMAFPLFNRRNVTVDGGGSLFLFHGRMSPFVLDGVQGATLKHFTIDWHRSFHDELHVVSRNPEDNSFIVAVDKKRYPFTIKFGVLLSDRYDWQDPMGSNIVFDPKTRSPIYQTRHYAVNTWRPVKATAVDPNRIKIEASVRKVAPPVGSVLVTYGVHPTSRLCPAIHVANSKDIKIENVTIHEAGGMGLIVERTENVRLEKMVVTSSKDRLVSTRADATHFIGCKGTIHVENCLFEHMLDDSINVHGAYVKVVKRLGGNTLLCEISHFQQWGLIFAGPGDKIALLSRKTILPFFKTDVSKIKILNERRFVLTVGDLPKPFPEGPLSVENLSWYPDLIMRKNIVRENRARSVLVTTKGKVLIEDNYFSSQMHGILIEGDNNKWYESGAVEDITIRNNVFDNVGYEVTKRYPLYASPLLTKEQHMGEGQYHRNIRFVGNTIKSFNGHLAFARSVEGLTIAGNTLVFSTDYPKAEEGPAIDLEYCKDVTIQGNKAAGFDGPSRIALSADTADVTIKDNQGFQVQK